MAVTQLEGLTCNETFNEQFTDDFHLDDNEISLFLDSIKELEERHEASSKQYTLFTGAARGSDHYWQKVGAKFGIRIKAFSFEAHGPKTNEHRVILAQQQLRKADKFLHKANKTLKRHFPTKKAFVDNLLRRNWYQVKDTDAVFAIGQLNFGRSIVEGGTGWAVQMAIDSNRSVYVFDITSCKWQNFDYGQHKFLTCEEPKLTVNFTGIGTRSLPESGKKAIERTFQKTFGKVLN